MPASVPSGLTADPAIAPVGPFDRIARAGLRAFGIDSEHAGLVALVAVLLFLLRFGDLIVANVAETLFVKRVGPGWLPLAFICQGVALVVALNYVGASLDRGRRVETLRTLVVGAAISPLVLRALIATGEPIGYAIMFVLFESAAVAMALAIWSVVGELVPGMDARRVGAPLLVAGLLGEASGSFVGAPIAARIGIENLLTVATLVAVAAGLILHLTANRMLVRLDVVRAPKLDAPNPRIAWLRLQQHTRDALQIGRRSTLLRFLLTTTALGAALGPFIDFQFHSFANDTFAAELDLLLFYGLLKGLLALAAIGLQLLAFDWLRREAGVANTLLTLPLGAAGSLVVMLIGGSVATASLVWAMLRLSGAAVDEPARRFLHDLFPSEARDRVDWLVNRNGRALAVIAGGVALVIVVGLAGQSAAVGLSVVLALAWLVVALVLRARYGQLVLQTSLANRIDFDQLRTEDVGQLLDRNAVRLLEREAASGVPARVQLAIELLRQIRAPRLPQLLAASYIRQPPVLRPLFLSTMQDTLRELPQGWPGVRSAAMAIARLARARLSAPERAVLIRVYGQTALQHSLDRREVQDFLESMSRDESTPVRLAVAGARYRLEGDDTAPELERALAAALASPDEQDTHLAISEIEELIRLAPPAIDRLLAQLLSLVDDQEHWSPRVRAHAISSAARLREVIGARADTRLDFDVRIVPLCLDADPRLAAAALDYLRDGGFLSLLETHVLPNLVAANHHVREQAREVVRHFGLAAVPALLDVVRSGSRRERVAVARLLGDYPIARAVHRDLIAQEMRGLEEQLVEVQMLRATGEEAYELLASRLHEEATEHVRAVLRLIYADTGDQALTRIERQIWSHDADLRLAAVEALDHVARRYPETAGLRGLIDDRPLAERAADARARVPNPPTSINDLLRRCVGDGNWVTRLVACHTIGAAGRRDLADALVDVTVSPRPALRREAERALELLSDSPSTEENEMTIVEKMLLLKETDLFRNLDARDLAGIAGVVKERTYGPGEMIIKEGDRGDFLAIVVGGKVAVVKGDGKGGEFHIRDLGAPELVGEMALLEEAPRSASIRSLDRAQLLLLSRSEFEALTEEYPGIAIGIARVLSRRLQTLTAQTARR